MIKIFKIIINWFKSLFKKHDEVINNNSSNNSTPSVFIREDGGVEHKENEIDDEDHAQDKLID